MCFIAKKHVSCSIKAMLLCDKSNALIFRKHNKNCNTLIINVLQNRSFSHHFQEKKTFVDFDAKEMLKRNVNL